MSPQQQDVGDCQQRARAIFILQQDGHGPTKEINPFDDVPGHSSLVPGRPNGSRSMWYSNNPSGAYTVGGEPAAEATMMKMPMMMLN